MLKRLLLSLVLVILAVGVAGAQTVAVLPNAMTQFVDGNGAPYAGGHVYMYIPQTTTPKATYQDPLGHTPNQNPITLDANGRAIIWGNGEYRQVLQDAYGNVVWDQITYASPVPGSSGGGAIWYGTATGTANAITLSTPAGFIGTDGQTIGFIAAATNTSSVTVNASGYGSVLLEKNTSAGLAVLNGGEIATGNLYYATYSTATNTFTLTAYPLPSAATATAYSGIVTDPTGAYHFAPVVDAIAAGASPTATSTANVVAFNTAFAAATAGATSGKVHIPCGTYTLNAPLLATVADKTRFALIGDGSDCVVLAFQGTTDGVVLTMGGGNASFDIEGITFTTDQAGSHTALITQLTNGTGSTFGPTNIIRDVSFRPSDMYQAPASASYWGYGWQDEGVNNVNVFAENCLGGNQAAANAGDFRTICNYVYGSGYDAATSSACLSGNPYPGCYAVAVNFFGSFAAVCNQAFQLGDWQQGVSIFNPNITACNYGVYQPSATPVGTLTELQMIGGQTLAEIATVRIEDPGFIGIYLAHMNVAVQGGTGFRLHGYDYSIIGNVINCVVLPNTTAIQLRSASGLGGMVSDNTIGFCNQGIVVDPSVDTSAVVTGNNFTDNGYASFGGTISNGSGGAGTTLTVSGYGAVAPLGVGTYINGVGVVAGTHITALGTGTGGDGTYTVNASQLTPTTGTETMSAQWLATSPFDYIIGAGSSSTKITDTSARAFYQMPVCNSTILTSQFVIIDSPVTTFNATISTGGGGQDGHAYCSVTAGAYTLH